MPVAHDAEVVVIGAGVVGLAVAARLARRRSTVVIERHSGPGRETSGHNSGVIHSGLYYPAGSLKHRTCIEGNAALYAWAVARGVPLRRTGKLIVALDDEECPALETLAGLARERGIEGATLLDAEASRLLEPFVPALAGLYVPTTGIIDTALFARSIETAARDAAAVLAYQHTVVAAERVAGGFQVTTSDAGGVVATLRCAALVNAAGLGAPVVAALLGYPLDGGQIGDIEVPVLRQAINRGRYYDVIDRGLARAVSRPIYPMPQLAAGGLGVHLTLDLEGGLHLGPDTEWLPADAPLDYRADDVRRDQFLEAGRRLLPALRDDQLAPGQVGYRPKLQRPGEEFADFLVWHDRGYVHLGGIESPGLTASLPLAGLVAAELA